MLEFFMECIRCYYVERKLLACGGSITIFLGMFYGLQSLEVTSFLILILSIIFALIGGNVIYVLTSESYFLPCCQSTSNAFVSNNRVFVV